MIQQKTYEERQEEFEHVKARLRQILHDHPEGLTIGQIQPIYLRTFRHMALLDNRLREMRADGEVVSELNAYGVLVWKLKREGEDNK